MNLSKKDYDEIHSMLLAIAELLPPFKCEMLHHDKKDQHTGVNCPVVDRLYRRLDKLYSEFGIYDFGDNY